MPENCSSIQLPICHNLLHVRTVSTLAGKQIVEEYFDAVSRGDDWIPRYNIAPTQTIPVIRQNPQEPVREISLMRWGLIPHWAKDHSIRGIAGRARAATR
jgi:putative SOS response-associated peptidase YedK